MAFTYNPLVEMWTLYAVGSLLIFLRSATRLRMVGLQGFKPDDYLIWFSWVCCSIHTSNGRMMTDSASCNRSFTL